MACNQDGVKSQAAAGAMGAGDTEVLQMAARGGETLWDDDLQLTQADMGDSSTIVDSVNEAEADDVRQPFVITDGKQGYTPCESPEDAIRMAKEKGGAAYVYDEDHHPANSPRSPVAVFDNDGSLMMHRTDWADRVQGVANAN